MIMENSIHPLSKRTKGHSESLKQRNKRRNIILDHKTDDSSPINRRRSDRTRLQKDNSSIKDLDLIMADLVHTVCRKKTFFICLTAICLALLVAAIIVASILNKPSKDNCLSEGIVSCNQSTFYRFYGTKTDYFEGRGELESEGKPKERDSCKPTELYLVSRHATRYPDDEDIAEMLIELPKLRSNILNNFENSKLCNTTKEEFEKWTLQMEEEDDNHITESGKIQSKKLGENFRKMYPTLFSAPYNGNLYKFRYTSQDRTKETAVEFAEGVFGKRLDDKEFDSTNSAADDEILRFHKDCDKKLNENTNYKKTKPEEELKFLTSNAMNTTLDQITERLGFNVTTDQVKMMLRTCQFEYAIDGKSVWCHIFSESDVKVFEYLEDLNDYYSDGYGGPERNYRQACPLVKDLLNQFRLAKQGEHPNAYMMFSHAGAMKKILSAFGLFKDDKPLLADNYCASSDRKWKSSLICPFMANIAFTLYKCDGDQNFKIETLVNEKPVKIKGCSNELCSFKEFEEAYQDADTCDLNKVCVLEH